MTYSPASQTSGWWKYAALRPNNSFKPRCFVIPKPWQKTSCHGVGSTTQVGLTQALAILPTFPALIAMIQSCTALALALVATFAYASDIESVLAHPPVDAFFSCSEHFQGQFAHVGDALGSDCVPQRLVEEDGRTWSRAYSNQGHANEDWYGWHMELLSPCSCEVVGIHSNDVQNEPGIMGKGRAASLLLKRERRALHACHVRDVVVKEGERVSRWPPNRKVRQQRVFKISQYTWAAWRGKQPSKSGGTSPR